MQKSQGAPNIETSKDEMAVIDNVLFRCWQMGWLDKLEEHSRQQAEIERLRRAILSNQNAFREECWKNDCLEVDIENLKVELKAMRGAANGYKAEAEKLHPYKLHYGNLKTEIIREFADRLKAKGVTAFRGGLVVTGNNIDNLLKEMEAENGSEASE